MFMYHLSSGTILIDYSVYKQQHYATGKNIIDVCKGESTIPDSMDKFVFERIFFLPWLKGCNIHNRNKINYNLWKIDL